MATGAMGQLMRAAEHCRYRTFVRPAGALRGVGTDGEAIQKLRVVLDANIRGRAVLLIRDLSSPGMKQSTNANPEPYSEHAFINYALTSEWRGPALYLTHLCAVVLPILAHVVQAAISRHM